MLGKLKRRLKKWSIHYETINNESDPQQFVSPFYVYDPNRIKIVFLFDQLSNYK
jgi:hypothetical protein